MIIILASILVLLTALLIFTYRILSICKTIKHEIIHHAWDFAMYKDKLEEKEGCNCGEGCACDNAEPIDCTCTEGCGPGPCEGCGPGPCEECGPGPCEECGPSTCEE